MMAQINIDLIVGRQVLTPDGSSRGRIEAIKLVQDHDAWMISEFHIGPRALVERLAVRWLPRLLRDVAQRKGRWRHQRISWDQIDVSDPRHPRLLCDVADVRGLA
ncbi:hypothetical protein QF001_003985 [Paraburkholderia youngii]|uniref:hypothetical protein n=1 Tax=Paraburkholderia youngii TaxID=2782701 RepID=UPI003D22998E